MKIGLKKEDLHDAKLLFLAELIERSKERLEESKRREVKI